MRRALLLALSLLAIPAVQAADLQPFKASYTADWKQLPMSGSAERSLTKSDNGIWTLNFKASMLVASLNEESTLKIEKNALIPLTYHFERGGLGKAKKIDLDFDWAAKMVTGTDQGDAVKVPLLSGMLDKSTYQLALQRDVEAGKKSMSYQVVDGNDVDTYDFRVIGPEVVETKAGKVDAIKVERVRDPTQNKRITEMWSPRAGVRCWSNCVRSKKTARNTTSCCWTARWMANRSRATELSDKLLAASFKKTSLRRGFFWPVTRHKHETFFIKLISKSVNTPCLKGCRVYRFLAR